MHRRQFLAGAAAIPGIAATAQAAPQDTAGPFVGVQLGPQSVFDEGPEPRG